MFKSYLTMLKYTFNFYSIESRRTYWYAMLVHGLITLILWLVGALFTPFLIPALIYTLLSLVPFISISIRRLHDTDTSGWYLALLLVPIAGIVFVTMKLSEPTQYDPNTAKCAEKHKEVEEKPNLATDPKDDSSTLSNITTNKETNNEDNTNSEPSN